MSLTNIEKNDVDISKLFAYKSEITILPPGLERPVVFYQRVVGDSIQGQAKVYALRKGAELRENLRNPKWENKKAYIPNFSKMKKDEVINIIVALSLQELSIEAINETQVTEPKEPDGNSTLEEQENYQKEIDDYPDRYGKQVAKSLETKVDVLKKALNQVSKDLLIGKYEEALINQLVSNEFTKHFQDYVTYHGTFNSDEYVNRIFKSMEDFTSSPTELRKALISNYNKLELKSQDLKKLPGAMP